MRLYQILAITPGVTALIGSGGKTTALYRLTAELAELGSVLCCTTTHIYPPTHLPILADPDVDTLRAALRKWNCLCVGSRLEDGKLGQAALSMAELAAAADYVLVETDGSRGLPCKAHLPHEPMVPREANQTVCLVGASGFGRPVRDVVHRPERFCALSGLGLEAPVTPAAIASTIRAEQIADRVFVNQVETACELEQARLLAAGLPCPVAAGAIQKGEWTCLS